ncbi:MAG TPA: hypothetical protein VF525_04425 [Pyrinomonadaceae bacterium]|jgi:hypothetical protein
MSRQSPSRDRFEDYVPVAERLEKFYERFPDGRVITHIIQHDLDTGFILMRAEVYRNADDAQPAATGHAFEVRSEGYVQKTSYVEVCETSSVGRALALLGFEVKRGIASREEIEKPLRMAAGRTPQQPAEPTHEEQSERLDAEILQSAATLGYDAIKVRKWVNQKFKVTEGLTGLSPDLKREVLKTFRENAANAQAKAMQK